MLFPIGDVDNKVFKSKSGKSPLKLDKQISALTSTKSTGVFSSITTEPSVSVSVVISEPF